MLGALILQAAYGAVDLLVVGWFGDASSISAVGTGSNFMQMVTLIITSLAMGSTVMIGQHIGEGKPDKAGKTVGTSIVLFAIIGVVMTVILELFAGPIANILQVPAESFGQNRPLPADLFRRYSDHHRVQRHQQRASRNR